MLPGKCQHSWILAQARQRVTVCSRKCSCGRNGSQVFALCHPRANAEALTSLRGGPSPLLLLHSGSTHPDLRAFFGFGFVICDSKNQVECRGEKTIAWNCPAGGTEALTLLKFLLESKPHMRYGMRFLLMSSGAEMTGNRDDICVRQNNLIITVYNGDLEVS